MLTASALDELYGAEISTLPLASAVIVSTDLPPETAYDFAGLLFQLKCSFLMRCGDPRSMVMLAVAFVKGCQVVALLPSMAAMAYCPGTMVSAPIVKEVSV